MRERVRSEHDDEVTAQEAMADHAGEIDETNLESWLPRPAQRAMLLT